MKSQRRSLKNYRDYLQCPFSLGSCNTINVVGDELLLNFGAKSQR